MSDGTYGLVMALTCLAYIGVLWVRRLRGRSLRRLLESLDEKQLQVLEEELRKDKSGTA